MDGREAVLCIRHPDMHERRPLLVGSRDDIGEMLSYSNVLRVCETCVMQTCETRVMQTLRRPGADVGNVASRLDGTCYIQ